MASTDPVAGSTVYNGASVTIQVSNGVLGTVPTGIVGSTVTQAKAALTAAGFANVTVAPAKGGKSDPSAKVTAVSPAEGTPTRKDAPITLTTG